jgi:glycerophosphoryl diester phosphodiesterase
MKRLAATVALLLAAGAVAAFDLQGHRGARGLLPENTLPSFQRALELGVTTLELDIAVTKDGVLVISHDSALNPDITRDATGRFIDKRGPVIHALSWDELSAYDVGRIKPGTEYARQFPDQQPLDGVRIPRLADLFELVRRSGDDKVRFAIETKLTPDHPHETPGAEAFAGAVVSEIRKAGFAARSQILSFDWRTLQVVQRIAPEIETVYLSIQRRVDNIGARRTEGSQWTAGFQFRDHGSVPRMIKAAGGRVWSAFFRDLDAQNVREAQTLGLKVMAWTVNDPVEMARVVDLGVDGLITDRPDLARKVLQERNIRWR